MKALHVILLVSLALLGCRSRSADHRPPPPPPDPNVELPGDPQVESELETSNIRTTIRGRDSVLEFDLRNRSSSSLSFAWTVEWYDRAGRRIAGSARAWTPTTLEGGASSPIQVPYPSPDATSWRLRAVRPG